MRKDLRGYNIFTLEDALEECGYQRLGYPSSFGNHWKRGGYHIILREDRRGVIFHIHCDGPYHIGPARKTGTDLKKEFRKIIGMYRKMVERTQGR